jgi:Domain of unknown function (DUF4157)
VADSQEIDELDEREERERAERLSDELAKKYDPERLLKLIQKRAGSGTPLEHSIRSRYEKRLGVDLGHVRIYTGEFAESFNKQRNAYAVTIGGTGMILMGGSPDKAAGSVGGQSLLAHELTHVAQQAKGLHPKSFGGAMPFTNEHELEADAVEHAVERELLFGEPAPTAGDSQQAADIAEAKRKAQAKLKQAIQQIKDRVIEMLGNQARNHHERGNFHARRG